MCNNIGFPNDLAKLIADCPTVPGQSVELRLFLKSNLSMVFLEEVIAEQDGGKSYDDLKTTRSIQPKTAKQSDQNFKRGLSTSASTRLPAQEPGTC